MIKALTLQSICALYLGNKLSKHHKDLRSIYSTIYQIQSVLNVNHTR